MKRIQQSDYRKRNGRSNFDPPAREGGQVADSRGTGDSKERKEIMHIPDGVRMNREQSERGKRRAHDNALESPKETYTGEQKQDDPRKA